MPIATLADVKSYLDITVADEDARITALLTASEGLVIKHLGYDPTAASRFDRANGAGGRCYVPDHYPLASVDSLSVDGATIPAETETQPGWYVDEGVVCLSGGYRFAKGFGNVKLSYQAGYATIPAPIKQAVIETVALRLKEIDRIGVRSKSLAGETISYVLSELSASAKGYLNPYRKVF